MQTQPRTINVEGKEIPIFIADINSSIPMAIISQNVLKHLTNLLPKANFKEIKLEFLDRINYNVKNMEEFTEVLKEELEFHESINILKEYFMPSRETESMLMP